MSLTERQVSTAQRFPNSVDRAKVLSSAIGSLCALWCVEHELMEATPAELKAAQEVLLLAVEVLNDGTP